MTARNHFKTSERTPVYNCIAHVFDDFDRWWWPHVDAHWPPECPLIESIEAFHSMFLSLRYSECSDGELEPDFDKIALYALDGTPKHAARQVSKEQWSSKIGQHIDIVHTLDALAGPLYGHVVRYYRKPTGSTAISS